MAQLASWLQSTLLLLLPLLLALSRPAAAATVQKPHIVYFLVDDL
jgi:hypothetical protein